MDTASELRDLSAVPAISGQEDRLIEVVTTRLRKLGLAPHIDRLGNVTVSFGSSDTEASVLFFAHLDELGLIVKKIEEGGFLRVERIGGFPEKTMSGSFFDVHTLDNTRSYVGIGGCYSHHVTPPEKKFVVPQVKELYIDLGMQSREEVEKLGVAVGSMVTYRPTFAELGPHRITAKALDNRMGVFILLRLAEYLVANPPAATVHLCFSVQEEFNIRGCLPVFERLLPQAAVCLDVTPSLDTPELLGSGDMKLGGGPAITYFNFHGRGALAGLIPNPKLTAFIRAVALSLDISCQHDVTIGVITDDAYTQLAGIEGVAMAHIAVPLRYTHAPIETIDLRDLEGAVELCCAVASRFDSSVDLSRGSFA